MRILDQVVIGQNRALILAEIAGKIYVLGITEHNITKLLEIDDPSKVALFSAEEMEEVYSNSLWKRTLEQFCAGNRWWRQKSKDFREWGLIGCRVEREFSLLWSSLFQQCFY